MLTPYYTPEQWTIFIRYYAVDAMHKKISEQHVFCAELNGQIIGTIALDNDFVVGFYTRLHYMNKGIGKMLTRHLEEFALQKDINEIQLASSPEGLAFYNKNGWKKVKDVVMVHYGVGFEETLMTKKLGE